MDAEGSTPPVIEDHEFVPGPRGWWDRCAICKLAEAAHIRRVEPALPLGTGAEINMLDAQALLTLDDVPEGEG